MDEVMDIVRSRKDSGATEIHIVGGVHPTNDLYYYAEMIRRIKQIMPDVAIKAFTAVELNYMIRQAGLTLEQGLTLLKEAGMESIPGGGAEIFAPEIRTKICPQKGSAEEWLTLHRTAHGLGIDSNATMLYGHIEGIEHRIDHLMRLRELQDTTGGINAFIPLKFRSANNSMSALGETSVIDDLRTLAMSRLILDNVPHIKAYWVMYGKETTELALAFGADDIDGTIDDSTKIYSMAGAADVRPTMSVEDIKRICSAAGFTAVERDTHYNEIK
jgi:aminodeoxyfutalosine synthase